MSRCTGCEVLPEAPPLEGLLYLAPPLGHTYGRLRRFLCEGGFVVTQPDASILAVGLFPDQLPSLLSGLEEVLSEGEMRETRSLVVPPDSSPTLSDLMRMQPLSVFAAGVEGQWLVDALRHGRFFTHFHAIVHAADPARVFGHECLLRAQREDGEVVLPGRLFETARKTQLLFHVDRAARLAAIRSARDCRLAGQVFINFNPTAIYDPVFCLQSTAAAIREADLRPDQIVFEVVESDEVSDNGHLLRILQFYRESGYRVALDDLGSGYSSLNLLTLLRPDFIKLDMQLIRDVDTDDYKAQIAAKLLELARAVGVRTIAEGVETPGEWAWCRDHGADYVQGYLFGRPSPEPVLRLDGHLLAGLGGAAAAR